MVKLLPLSYYGERSFYPLTRLAVFCHLSSGFCWFCCCFGLISSRFSSFKEALFYEKCPVFFWLWTLSTERITICFPGFSREYTLQ